MKAITVWSKVVTVIVLLCLKGEGQTRPPVPDADSPQAASCAALEYHQFDFWMGDWDAFDIDGAGRVSPSKSARVRVDRILEGCVLREEYEGTDGLKGQSFSIYDASRKLWHQSWVTNRGQLLVIEGSFTAGEMVLTGVEHKPGIRTIVRGTWKMVNGGVRETAVTSTDRGKTWKPWFDILFRRHER